jgi:hypothetical protein
MGKDYTSFDGQDEPLEMDQSAAHRQLVASAVVALGIIAVAATMAMRPAYQTAPETRRQLAGVQQPTFVTSHNHFLAAIRKSETELP